MAASDFSYVHTVNQSSIHSDTDTVQMFEKVDSDRKWTVAPLSKLYCKIWVGFCLNTEIRFILKPAERV